jgi:hypothetical protein
VVSVKQDYHLSHCQNFRGHLSQRNYSSKFKEAILNSRDATVEETGKVGADVIIPIDGIPIPLKLQDDKTHLSDLKTKYQRNATLDLEKGDLEWIKVKLPCHAVYTEWSKCMENFGARGLKSEIVDGDKLNFSIKLKWMSMVGVNEVLIRDFIVPRGIKCEPRTLKKGDKLSSEWVSQPCSRTQTGSTLLTVNVMKKDKSLAGALPIQINPIPFPDIQLFTVGPQSLIESGTVTLSWRVGHAVSVKISPDFGSVPLSGSRAIPITATKTYTLVAIGEGDNITQAQVTVMVIHPPPVPLATVRWIQAKFFTGSDDKDSDLGINERLYLMPGSQIIGHVEGYHRGLRFVQGNENDGMKYQVNLSLAECDKLKYQMTESNNDGWDVMVEVRAGISDGPDRIVGRWGSAHISNGSGFIIDLKCQ